MNVSRRKLIRLAVASAAAGVIGCSKKRGLPTELIRMERLTSQKLMAICDRYWAHSTES